MIEPHRECASILITDSDKRILFVRQSYGMKFYGLPGGVVEHGETPPMAAIREALEEVGIDVAIEYQLGAYLLTGGGWPDIFASVYKGHIIKGKPRVNADEIAEILWRHANDLPFPLLPDAEAGVEDFVMDEKGIVRTYQRTIDMPVWCED